MPATDRRMSEAELLDRVRLVSEAFRPAAPIDRRSLFSGRADQISEIFSVVSQPGQHGVVYGERGVGKTSLAAVAAELLGSANVRTARATCDVSDDFASLWRKALDEIELPSSRQAIGFADRAASTQAASARLGSGSVTPDAVRTALEAVARDGELAIFIDEFDRLLAAETRVLFADTIKVLSDRLVRATIFVIGVADSVGELIREHRSVERALVQIHMPRMTRDELTEIVEKGMEAARLTIAGEAARKITVLSQGLPHYTQLLAQLAAQSAVTDRRTDVTARDVDAAVARAVERAQQSVVEGYRDATAGASGALYPQVLLACALAEEDEFGFFTAADVSEPLGRILGKPCKTVTFARHLDRLASETRGGVLQKHAAGGRVRYRFENPLLQPYVTMRGLADGVVRTADLR